MATHSSILAWRMPRTEKPGGLQSTGLWRVGHDWATFPSLLHFKYICVCVCEMKLCEMIWSLTELFRATYNKAQWRTEVEATSSGSPLYNPEAVSTLSVCSLVHPQPQETINHRKMLNKWSWMSQWSGCREAELHSDALFCVSHRQRWSTISALSKPTNPDPHSLQKDVVWENEGNLRVRERWVLRKDCTI